MKVVIHVGSIVQWNVAVTNSVNLRAASSEATIEIVVNSAAMSLFKEFSEDLNVSLKKLSEVDATVKLCRNAIRAQGIDESTLPSDLEVVPAGILELIKLQDRGYAYISP